MHRIMLTSDPAKTLTRNAHSFCSAQKKTMECRKIKLKVHSRNFSEEDLIVNCEALSREKWDFKDGDLLEIYLSDDQATTCRSHLILQVKTLPPDIQSKGGPFSVLQEVAVAFTLTGVREVCVRKVDRRDVALDMVELSFKDQYITRSDMWRITCSLLNRCLYKGKHLQHCTMRMQTHCLWFQGEKVTAGAVTPATRVVFRSASAHVFLFIQISSEMWDFDPNGEFFFDKAVNGFLRELFLRWREAGCNHDVTIVFFWRLHYDPTSLKNLLPSQPVHEDRRRGVYYEDFFRVIVESSSNSDWSCELINIKKSFLKLKPLIHSLRGRDNAALCKSEEGNILEAINLALNVLERHNVDTNLQLSGQQIVVLTAGTGYFEIDRELMQLTNERLVYGGVTTDLVSMRAQPLHAMPMFKFHSKEEEFFSVPHWINYSFYSSAQGRPQTGFQPRIYLSDHLVNTYLQRDLSKKMDTQLYNPNTSSACAMTDPKIPTWVDYDMHDAAVFDQPNARLTTKVQSTNRVISAEGRGGSITRQDNDDSPDNNTAVTFHMGGGGGGGGSDIDPFDQSDSISSSPNPIFNPIFIETTREAKLTRSLAPPPRQRYKSENFSNALTADKLDSSGGGTRRERTAFVSVGSAEALRQGCTPWGSYRDVGPHSGALQKKRLSFSNPFDPNRMHSEAPAFQRRWAHVFPTNKRGVAFQTHHESAPLEVNPTVQHFGSANSTPQNSVRRKGVLKHSIDASTAESSGGLSASSSHRGSFKDSNFASSVKKSGTVGFKQSPVDTSSLRTSVKQKGSPSANGSSVSGWGKGQTIKMHTPNSSLQVPVKTTPETIRHHVREKWRDPLPTGTEENFSSVRRTGVDWTSLVAPAHLPVTTDFYPAKEILDRDYVEYNTNLVVFREESLSDGGDKVKTSNEKKSPVWYSDHSTMTTFQAFQEMISQRLSQGFQLTCSPLSERGVGGTGSSLTSQGTGYNIRDLNTVYVLHEALERLQQRRRKKKGGSDHRRQQNECITIHMGLSHVFQKLVLAFQDISVFIYRLKSPPEGTPWSYSYQLSSAADNGVFKSASAQFTITSDDYNWNFLDHHVCGYSDFEELGESLRYWELRYLLLPRQCPTLPPLSDSSELMRREQETLIANFVRFLEFLNRIKKSVIADTRRSSQASIPSISRHNSLPVASTTPLRVKVTRTSISATPDPIHITGSLSRLSSLSPTPTPIPSTLSRSRQLSEIEEEEERKAGVQHNHLGPSSASFSSVRMDGGKPPEHEKDSRRGRGGERDDWGVRGGISWSKSEAKSVRHRRRQSAAEVETGLRKVRSRDNLLAETGSHSRPESPTLRREASKSPSITPSVTPSVTPYRGDTSKSPSVTPSATPLTGETSKFSPRTERKKILSKLRKIASSSDSSTTSDSRRETILPQSSLSPSVTSQREADLESSLDFHKRSSTIESDVHEEEVPTIEEPVNINSPLDVVLQAMENENDGIDFLGPQVGLRRGCFISMDAVKWVVENVKGIGSRRQATKILQSMITEQMLVHASGDPTVPFIDGYFIYCMPHREAQEEVPKEMLDSSFYIVNRDFDSFSKKWFETEIEFPSTSVVDTTDDRSNSPSSPPSLTSSYKNGHPYYMGFEQHDETYVPPSFLNRRVELNPDPHFHSSRPEWCYMHYDPVYNPNEAFQLSFQWMVATTNLLSTLMQMWVRNASMCDFNLVAVPVHKSLLQDQHRSTHPFRKPSFIPLSLPADIQDEWREEGDMYCVADRTKTLLLAIASRNGFLRDCAKVPPESSILSPHFGDTSPSDQHSLHFYVHHKGTALIQPVVEIHTADITTEQYSSDFHSLASSVHSTTKRGSRQLLLHPCHNATSTPLIRSPAKPSHSTQREGSVCSDEGGTACRNSASHKRPHREGTSHTHVGANGDPVEPGEVSRSGFYWHRNTLLGKQKNVPLGLIGRYDEILQKFTQDCQNQDGILNHLCELLFTR